MERGDAKIWVIIAGIGLIVIIGMCALIPIALLSLFRGDNLNQLADNYGAGGTGSCANTQALSGVTIPGGGKGKIVREQHLATTAETFNGSAYPSSENDQIERHYQLTAFSQDCPKCPKEGFTPSAGGGNVGGGYSDKPSPQVEPWIMNMREHFPKGSKIIITSTKTGKSVVAAGGYEYGPEAGSRWIAGAQSEVLYALGIDTDSEVTIGFAQDQSLPFGPVTCAGTGGSSSVTCLKHDKPGDCGVASVAMLINFYTGNLINPDMLNWSDGLVNILQRYVTQKRWCTGSNYLTDKAKVTQMLSSGQPVIFFTGCISPTGKTSSSMHHIMVMTGYNASTDTVSVNNSLPNSCTNQQWPWQIIASCPGYGGGGRQYIYACGSK